MQAFLEERLQRLPSNSDDEIPPSDNPSWYAILSEVVTSLVHQFILLKLGYQTAGGKRDQYDFFDQQESRADFDKTNVAKLMNRIPTELNTFKPFPIYPYTTLKNWHELFRKITDADIDFSDDEFVVSDRLDRLREP